LSTTSQGLTAAVDPALHERTFKLLQSSVHNQDLVYFFRRFAPNSQAIIPVRDFFEKNYNSVRILFLTRPSATPVEFW